MKYGLHALHRGDNTDPRRMVGLAQRAEALGFESLWVGDHIALPDDAPDPATEPRLEALITLAFLAAHTTRVRLGIGVLVLPQRQPVLLAKQLASLDVLSGGRLVVGVAAGYVEAELAAFGVPLDARGARTDEHLDALKALWALEPDFEGETVRYGAVSEHPTPLQKPHPPIVVGGHARPALARAASYGDGWFGWGLSPSLAATKIAELAALRRGTHRADVPLEVTVVPDRDLTARLVHEYEAAGVHRLVVVPDSMLGSGTEQLMERVAADLIGA